MQIDTAISAGQLIQYLFFLAISTCVGWIVKVLPSIRDDVRAVKREVMGLDGKNGLLSRVAEHEGRLDVIDERHIRIDAATEVERELLRAAGLDRRLLVRREADRREEEKP